MCFIVLHSTTISVPSRNLVVNVNQIVSVEGARDRGVLTFTSGNHILIQESPEEVLGIVQTQCQK